MLDNKPDDRLLSPMQKQEVSNAAKTLRSIPSLKRIEASKRNGRKGGRPRKKLCKNSNIKKKICQPNVRID